MERIKLVKMIIYNNVMKITNILFMKEVLVIVKMLIQ